MKNQRVKGILNEKPAGEGHPSMKNQRVKGIPKNTKAPHRAGLQVLQAVCDQLPFTGLPSTSA